MTGTTTRPSDMPPALSPTELLYADIPNEFASTRRLLERYPDGRGDWRPHDKSRSLGELATHLAELVNRGTTVLETDSMEIGVRQPRPPVDSAAELLQIFDAAVQKFTAALANADYATLAKPWAMRRGDRVLVERPKRDLVRVIMASHMVHHCAQLGVYYRLLGVAVPGVYGPSADEAVG